MSKCAEYEIGSQYKPGGIVLVGDMPGVHGQGKGRVSGPAWNQLLDECLREAGLRRADIAILYVSRYESFSGEFRTLPDSMVAAEIRHLHATLERLRPSFIVALGAHAAFASLDDTTWPSRDGSAKGAYGAEERRGYWWDGRFAPVLSTIHPADAVRQWVPWRILLSWDLQKAKEQARSGHLRRPEREVEIITDARAARSAVSDLRRAGRFASDIEIHDERRLACIGFAARSDRAFVFPEAHFDAACELLGDSHLRIIWQNGQFDLHFLLTRCGVRVKACLDDTLLAWHACYPELAGAGFKAGGGRKTKRTHKSLAFFASLFTNDYWWKGEYETEHEFFIYNGKDCCITYDVFANHLEPLVEKQGVRAIYEHEIGLIWPVVEMQARGLRVDNEERLRRIAAIEGRVEEYKARINELVVPLLEERWEQIPEKQRKLFEQIEGVCPCCRHAKTKQLRCWSCAGFEKAPSKKDLVNYISMLDPEDSELICPNDPMSLKKGELEELVLGVCKVCNGKPRREWLEYNPASSDQTRIVLYDLLKLPKRFNQGKLTTDEEALKSLIGAING